MWYRGLQARQGPTHWVHSDRAQVFFLFLQIGLGSDSAHLAYLLLLCPYTCSAHMATVWNTDYIINIIHRLRIYSHINIQVIVDSASGRSWSLEITKSFQCFRKSGIFGSTMHLRIILTRHPLIGCAFREKCIFRDVLMKVIFFYFVIQSFL